NLKFKAYLLENNIIDEQWLSELEQEHKDIINKATKTAEEAPYPSTEEAYAYVYEEGVQDND
ncbi:thiamine pyrophosphate-dependent dehydrogenase E1 component subunit alpha, partial [Staphylococcus epidermidis]